MTEKDTIYLLRECDAGVEMGISAIDDVLEYVHSESLSAFLTESRRKHKTLKGEIGEELDKYGDEGKDPNFMAQSMSWMKTNVKLALDNSDAVIADLITDGCNMGVKSLNRYLNQYEHATERSKEITKKLINLEETLAIDIRRFL